MERKGSRKRRAQSRVRNHRTARLVLFCLGATGFMLSAALLLGALCTVNLKLLWLGVMYLLGSLALLALRQAMVLFGQVQKQRCHRSSESEVNAL